MSEPADENPPPRRRRASPAQPATQSAAETAIAAASPPPPPRAEPVSIDPIPAESRGIGAPLIAGAAMVLIVIAAVAATPFWAPGVMRLLPWGPAGSAAPAAPPATAAKAETAPDPGIAAARQQAAQNGAALQQLAQRIAALEAKPAPDLAPLQQQVTALTKTNAELAATVASLQKAAQAQPAADPNKAALALALLQIREAVDLARPFEAEYQALVALAHDRPEIAAAAQPLAGPAASGVASRTALTERLRQLAPQIATARVPPKPGWKSQIVARLRALVTIRRTDGAAQTPAEAAVAAAERDMAAGDLGGAVDALSGLSGPGRDAAEPWLGMARQRLAVETTLRQVAAAVTVALGKPAPGKG